MAEGDSTRDDAADAGTSGGELAEGGGASAQTSGGEAAGDDPAGFESSGVGDPQHVEGDEAGGRIGGGQPSRAGDWNPGEHSGGGGELY